MKQNPSNRYDDLTRIKGIGESRQKWLRESMKVRTMEDLAALNIENFLSEIRAQGITIPQKKIEEWIQEARAFVQGESSTADQSPASAALDWQPSASFVVEIQTRLNEEGTLEYRTSISHVETDKDAQWAEVLPDAARQWMRVEAGLASEAAPPIPTLQPSPVTLPVFDTPTLEQPLHAAAAPNMETDAARLAKITPLVFGTPTRSAGTQRSVEHPANALQVIEKVDQKADRASHIEGTPLLLQSNAVPQSSPVFTPFSPSPQVSPLAFGHEHDEKIRQQLARHGLA